MLLRREQWVAVRTHLDPSAQIPVGAAELMRMLDQRKHAEPPARFLSRITRARVMGLKKWQADGLLLPHGHPRDDFDTVNP